jgi:hypothetical protein
MALALEQSHISGLNEIIATVGPLAQIDPTWLEFLNPATVGPHLVRAKGLPVIFLRTPEQMEELAQMKAQAAQAQAAQMASQSVRNMGGVDETAKAAEMLQA